MMAATGKRYLAPFTPMWFVKQGNYILFMLRELSAVTTAAFFLFWMYGLRRLLAGEAEWNAFLEYARSPGIVLFNLVALGLALVHTVTWFKLMPLIGDDANRRMLGLKVPQPMMAMGIWAGFAAVSVGVILVLVKA